MPWQIGSAVHCHAHELYIVINFVEIGVGPTVSTPERDEGPADGSVDHDEALVLLDKSAVVGPEDLGVGTQVETSVVTLDVVDVGLVRRKQKFGICLAVEDEDELGTGMKGVGDEELEVRPCVWGLKVGVEDERMVRQLATRPGLVIRRRRVGVGRE